MNYAEALGYLLDRETYLQRAQGNKALPDSVSSTASDTGSHTGLSTVANAGSAPVAAHLPNPLRMARLLEALGNPHTRFQSVHIAGTKGKGSTSALCESMLHAAGYRTGLFTSPHLHTFRERIRIDQALIGADEVADLLTRLKPIFDTMPDLTVFDRITAVAFVAFAEKGVEWAVLETGVGGRLDSTTVVTPAVCGITSISYDHMKLLGDTLGQIAREKAGIIKTGVPIFTSYQEPEALASIQAVAQERGVPLVVTVPTAQPPRNLPGEHQRVNAGLALAMIESLALRGQIQADPAALAQGLAQVKWPGRFEHLPLPHDREMPMIVDCAHNEESIRRLVETLAQLYPSRPVTFVVGYSQSKQIHPMLGVLLTYSPQLVLVSSHHPRALSVEELGQAAHAEAQRLGLLGGKDPARIHTAADMGEALDLAAALTPAGGVRVGTGSVFVAAELREAWAARYPGLFPPTDWVHQAPFEPTY